MDDTAYGVTLQDDEGKLYYVTLTDIDDSRNGGVSGSKTLANVAQSVEPHLAEMTLPSRVVYDHAGHVYSTQLVDDDGYGRADIDWVEIRQLEEAAEGER